MAITRVQTATFTTVAANVAVLTVTLGQATTSGNVLILGITSGNAGNVMKVTSAHGTFSDVTPQGLNTAGGQHIVHIFLGIMAGADTAITITSSSASKMAAVAVEYSGAHITYSDPPSNSQANTNIPTTGAITNANANSLYVGALGQRGTNSATTNANWCSTPSSPFLIQGQNTTNVNSGAVDVSIAYLDAIVSSSSARTANVTSLLGTLQTSGVLATFQEIISGGGIRAAGTGGLAV